MELTIYLCLFQTICITFLFKYYTEKITKKTLKYCALSKCNKNIICVKYYNQNQFKKKGQFKKICLKYNEKQEKLEESVLRKDYDLETDTNQNKITMETDIAGNMHKCWKQIKIYLYGIHKLLNRFCNVKIEILDGKKGYDPKALFEKETLINGLSSESKVKILQNIAKYGADLQKLIKCKDDKEINGNDNIYCYSNMEEIIIDNDYEYIDNNKPSSVLQIAFIKNGLFIYPINVRDDILHLIQTEIDWKKQYGIKITDHQWRLNENNQCIFIQKKIKTEHSKYSGNIYKLKIIIIINNKNNEYFRYNLNEQYKITNVINESLSRIKSENQHYLYTTNEQSTDNTIKHEIPIIAQSLSRIALNSDNKKIKSLITKKNGCNLNDKLENYLRDSLYKHIDIQHEINIKDGDKGKRNKMCPWCDNYFSYKIYDHHLNRCSPRNSHYSEN